MFKKSLDDQLKLLNELSQNDESESNYILTCIKTKMKGIRKTKIKDAVNQYIKQDEGQMKGCQSIEKKKRRSYMISTWQRI